MSAACVGRCCHKAPVLLTDRRCMHAAQALSFAAVIIAGRLGVTHSTAESIGVQLVRA